MRAAKLWTLLASAAAVRAAYVQIKHCSGTDDNVMRDHKKDAVSFDVQSVRASIEDAEAKDRSLVQISVIGLRDDAPSCDALEHHQSEWTFDSNLRIATLGGPTSYEGELENSTCVQRNEDSPPYTTQLFKYDIERPHLLDSLFLTIELEGYNSTATACLNAPLTPSVDRNIIQVATWVPAIIFFLVVIAALWREASMLNSDSQDSSDELGPLRREPSRTHVTRVADCISYLQFIFFSSALSLHFPGFLQPVTSRMSWSTLMLPAGVVVHDPWYSGVVDGLYEVNGTFGGTAGLELMTQVMGGTVTTDTWLNTFALAALVFVTLTGIVTLGQRLTWAKDWFQATHSLVFRDGQRNFSAILWTTLRLFCSYLLMPIVAWSAYVVGLAKLNPIYHTMAATFMLCVLIIVIWWTMWQGRPRNMGYLLIDSDKVHRNLTTLSRTQDLYSTGIFVLLFIRGAAIGGLQVVGTVQLLVLIATDVVQLALHAFVFRAVPYSSRTSSMPLVRLVILALQGGFLPGAAEHGVKMALGYIVLLIHVSALLFLFLAPTLWDLSNPLRGNGGHPQIFGLQQLMQRPSNPPNYPLPDNSNTHWADPNQHLSIPPSRPSSASPSRLSLATPSPIDGSYYFRPPRLSSAELISRASMGTPPIPESSTSATLNGSTSEESSRGETSYDCPRLTSGSGWSPASEGSKAGDERYAPSPLDPEVDYSVREADRYYVRPRKLSFRKGGGSEGHPGHAEQRGGLAGRISALWTPK